MKAALCSPHSSKASPNEVCSFTVWTNFLLNLPKPITAHIGPVGFSSLFLTSVASSEICSSVLLFLGINSHLLSSENQLHLGTQGFLLVANKREETRCK